MKSGYIERDTAATHRNSDVMVSLRSLNALWTVAGFNSESLKKQLALHGLWPMLPALIIDGGVTETCKVNTCQFCSLLAVCGEESVAACLKRPDIVPDELVFCGTRVLYEPQQNTGSIQHAMPAFTAQAY